MRVAVTGANGFLGSHLVRGLARRGATVTALVRPGSDLRYLSRARARVVPVDYSDERALGEALAGADAVVHNAGLASDWAPREAFLEANVALAARVFAAARASGAFLVHISSNAVVGEEDCAHPKSEDAPYGPWIHYPLERVWPSGLNHYRETKAEGERRVLALAREHGTDLTVLRPVWIFGPRELHAGSYDCCRTIASGVPFFPGRRSNLFHVVYVGDVVRAVAAVLGRRPAGVHVYHVGGARVPRMHEYWGLYARHMGVRPPRALPAWLTYPLAVAAEAACGLMGTARPPALTRARTYALFANNVYDTSRIERELGFRADADLDRAVRTTVRWWRLYGYLPRARRGGLERRTA